MDRFCFYAADLVIAGSVSIISDLGIQVHRDSFSVGTAVVMMGPIVEQFRFCTVEKPFVSEILIQNGLMCSIAEFHPVLLVLKELLQDQKSVLKKL